MNDDIWMQLPDPDSCPDSIVKVYVPRPTMVGSPFDEAEPGHIRTFRKQQYVDSAGVRYFVWGEVE